MREPSVRRAERAPASSDVPRQAPSRVGQARVQQQRSPARRPRRGAVGLGHGALPIAALRGMLLPRRRAPSRPLVVFSSPLFLFGFLPVFLTVYGALPARLRNLWATLGSLAFYAFGAPLFVYVLLSSTLLDWWISRRIEQAVEPQRRRWVALAVLTNVGLLAYFKYANFFVAQVDALLAWFGAGPVSWTAVALPIGISFFVFHKISYVVDVYRGVAQPARTYGDCLLYIVLFPQLIAGPIIRYHDIDAQIRSRPRSSAQFWRGAERFALGLGKKVLIADAMAALCDPVYKTPIAEVGLGHAWLAVVAYYFEIYFDFSGYSDLAIGLGRMLGFEFRENFDRPYTARTFTEFWRRWHISLSNFMRE